MAGTCVEELSRGCVLAAALFLSRGRNLYETTGHSAANSRSAASKDGPLRFQ